MQFHRAIGVPVKILHETTGTTCTIETKDGALFRGIVTNVEDCFNIRLHNVQVVDRRGRKSVLDNVFIRGSQVRYIVVPNMLRNSPAFSISRTIEYKSDDQPEEQPQKRQRR